MEKTNNDKRQVHADSRPRHIFCTETNFQQSLGIVKLKSFFFFFPSWHTQKHKNEPRRVFKLGIWYQPLSTFYKERPHISESCASTPEF